LSFQFGFLSDPLILYPLWTPLLKSMRSPELIVASLSVFHITNLRSRLTDQ